MIERYCKGCTELIETGNLELPRVCFYPGGARLRTLTHFSFYCYYSGRHRKIANKADWTGRVPKWCPRRKSEEVEE